jgi:poly-gamma-glutamate capsule biosynthesis protein CapA/YwtB (metallophosphatase superfamily)
MSKVFLVGDVVLPGPITVNFEMVHPWIANLEAPITRAARGIPATVNLKMEENFLAQSFATPPVAVSMANNHMMDFGEAGLRDTIGELSGMATSHFGIGTLAENCGNPTLLHVGDHQLGLCAYVCPSAHPVFAVDRTPGARSINLVQIRSDIALARARGATRVIVALHWGIEELSLPRPEDILIGRAIIDGGADLVIGHHAHCVQPFEVYKGRYIFYGLGNWVTPI